MFIVRQIGYFCGKKGRKQRLLMQTKSKPLKLNQVVIANISLNNIMKEKLQSGAQRKDNCQASFFFFSSQGFQQDIYVRLIWFDRILFLTIHT